MPRAERDAELRLDDILQAIARIRSYTAGMTFADFEASHLTFDAVVMNVFVIGESIGRLPDRLKTELGSLPWKALSPSAISSPTATPSWTGISSGISLRPSSTNWRP